MTTCRPARTAARAALPTQPISASDAQELGWSRAARQHAVTVGTAARPRRGVVLGVRASDEVDARDGVRADTLVAARAATLSCPRAVVSHTPGALAWGMPTLTAQLRPCLSVPAGTALRSLARLHLHRATLTNEDVVTLDGYRTTSAARTVLDIAREHGVPSGVIAADHALRNGLTTVDELAAVDERCAGWPGRKAAHRAVLLADGLAESPLESLSRLRMSGFRLPAPRLQVRIADRFGRFVARCDFYWDEYGVVGEADGAGKYRTGLETPVERQRRQSVLEDLGLVVERWGWADLSAFGPTAGRLHRAFGRGTHPGSPVRQWVVLPDETP